jgi:glycosyltransferase involved in cell wall biosynthesis
MVAKKAVIMQILPSLNNGGVERGVVDIAKSVLEAGFESIVVSSGGPMVKQFAGLKVKHITLPVHSKNPFTIFQNIKKLAKIIKEYEVNLVHIRSRAPAWVAYFACRKTNCQMASTIHGPYSNHLFSQKISKLKLKYNSVMLRPKFIIAVSNFIKNYIFENYSEITDLSKKETEVIHRGADLNYFSNQKVSSNRTVQLINQWNLPDDKQIIMLPARITAWKGHEFLVEALTKVKSQNFFCIMVGNVDGHNAFAKKLEQKIKDNSLEGKIKLVGQAKDMPAAYLVSDLVISSSIKPEAFGRVAIEAGAMGRIIIATNIGGSLETIIDGKTGFLVEAGNSDDLAAKIDEVLAMDKSKKEQICQNAVKHIAENFSNRKMLDATIKFYHKILATI